MSWLGGLRSTSEAKRFGCTLLPFPGTQKNLENFIATEEYQSVLKCWRSLDAAIVELERYPQVPDQATAIRFGSALREKKAVGGVLSYFYDISGTLVEGENDLVIRIPLELLKRVKKVFLICSGETVAPALLGALRMGIVTHLITDDTAAATLIDIDHSSNASPARPYGCGASERGVLLVLVSQKFLDIVARRNSLPHNEIRIMDMQGTRGTAH